MLNKQFNFIEVLKLSCFLIFSGNGIALMTKSSSLDRLFEQASTVELAFGLFLLVSSIPFLLPTSIIEKAKFHLLLLPSTLILFTTSYASFIQSGYVAEQLIEHGIKLLTPLVLFQSLIAPDFQLNKRIVSLKMLVALTFIGHGMFALGLHYVPNGFLDMTTQILGVSESSAYLFLQVAGVLDIVCAVLLFLNFPIRSVYWYLILWGLITAIARLVYGVFINEGSISELIYWASNMMYRLPHGIIPLLLLQQYGTKSALSRT